MKLAAVLLVATAFLLAGEASAFHSKHHKYKKWTPKKCEDENKKLETFLGSRCVSRPTGPPPPPPPPLRSASGAPCPP